MAAPSLDDLIALVHEQAPDDDPLTQLQAAATLKADVDELTDALLGHFVDQARRSGASWSQIGEALGVTKQAAQQRHTSTDSLARRIISRIDPQWGGNLRRFTARARSVVVAAQQAAVDLRHPSIGTEHVLLGLFAEPDAIAARILAERGVTEADVRAAVLEKVPVGPEPVEGHVPFTPRAKSVLELALQAALELGHNYIGTEHIVLGLLDEGEGMAATILHEKGVERDAVLADVIRMLSQL